MSYCFPDYSLFDLSTYGRHQGSSVLAFIQMHCKDVAIVGPEDWQSYQEYSWLEKTISAYLLDNKKVLLVPGEESFIYPVNKNTSQVLNQFQHQNVWLVTQLNPDSQKIYSFQHSLKIKRLEIPYVLLELCETYYKHHIVQQSNYKNNYNFLCMTARFDQHKGDLIKILYEHKLDQYGLITIAANIPYPEWYKQNCKINNVSPTVPVGKLVIDRLIDHNVFNFLNIEHEYKNIPLIVHAETSCGIFYTTEKTLWPLLLGKLCLIYGPPNNIKHIQRFYDLSFDRYADLSFDQTPEDWTTQDHRNRLKNMIEKNRDLLTSCQETYNMLVTDLESARWTIGKNLYNFLTSQLETITKEY
jgi:hypothetical protein